MAALQDSNHKPLIPLTMKLQGVILETQRNAKIQVMMKFVNDGGWRLQLVRPVFTEEYLTFSYPLELLNRKLSKPRIYGKFSYHILMSSLSFYI
ncbi:uncharacterized protein LOC111495205 isoform X1 [Cucurbita maxima]|uniref:Uncharacterized protein LOC111495205 isoform X1 n=1 Tax=Cucurbita maxima TaxID=3661 RepID=A0A6J1KJL3_CUCMA|nr:uncharacterized protein LOC111495205 isoform X1 [Cucurbita maxima]